MMYQPNHFAGPMNFVSSLAFCSMHYLSNDEFKRKDLLTLSCRCEENFVKSRLHYVELWFHTMICMLQISFVNIYYSIFSEVLELFHIKSLSRL